MTTTEKNKLIAEFMGITFTKENKANHPKIKAPFPPVESFKYHSSRDWLMPVVEKIESLETSNTKEYFKQSNKVCALPIYTKIEAVYNACVEFILWYNQNKS